MPRRLFARVSLVLLGVVCAGVAARADIITTIAGGGDHDVPALQASSNFIGNLVVDPSGGLLVTGRGARVFRITPNGRLLVVAGNGVGGYSGDGGPAAQAMFSPSGIAVDQMGNIYVADGRNNRIRRVDAATGIVSTFAGTGQQGYSGDGGPAMAATFGNPDGVALDPDGNLFFSADNRVRRIAAGTGIVTTVAGTGAFGYTGDFGPATAATFRIVTDVKVDSSGNLFVVDIANRVIRRIDRITGIITTVAGNGGQQINGDGQLATAVGLENPRVIVLDPSGRLFLSDGNRLRTVDPATGVLSTIAGSTTLYSSSGDGGPAADAGLALPNGLAVDRDGNIFLTESFSGRIRRIDAATRIIDTIAGAGGLRTNPDGLPAGRLGLEPRAAAVGPTGDLFFADSVGTQVVIRRVDATTSRVETIAGGGSDTGDDVAALSAHIEGVRDLEFDPSGRLYILEGGYYVEPNPNDEGGFFGPHRVRRFDAPTGRIVTVAGSGQSIADGVAAASSRLLLPVDIAFNSAGDMFIAEGADFSNGPTGLMCVRKVSAADGRIVTMAGNGLPFATGDGGPARNAGIGNPLAIAVDPVIGDLYIASSSSGSVRRVSAATGIITTVTNTFALSLAMKDSSTLYMGQGFFDFQLQSEGGLVLALDIAAGTVAPYAGNGLTAFGGDGGPALQARLGQVTSMSFDPDGHLVLVDSTSQRIRQIGSEGLANSPPHADAGADVQIGCGGSETTVRLDGSASTDPDGDQLLYEWYRDFGQLSETLLGTGRSIEVVLASGHHTLTLRVEDPRGLSSYDTIEVDISGQDLKPPTISLALDPDMLWPPAHHLVDVTAYPVAGDDCGPPAVILESITSDEPDDAPGQDDGATHADVSDAVFGTDDRQFRLRAERDGQGDGRTYTVTYRAVDASGKSATASAAVFVPHDHSGLEDPLNLALDETALGTRLSWDPVWGAISYDAIRGDLLGVQIAPQEIHLGTVTCVAGSTSDTTTAGHEDVARPAPGRAFFYLVQYDDGRASGFGSADAQLPRAANGGCR